MKVKTYNIWLILSITIIFQTITFTAYTQSPQKINYQAVIRNITGDVLQNTVLGMRVSIINGSASGTIIYQETYNPNPQSNAYGVVNIEIGSGIPIIGTFSSINWGNGPFFIKIETDPTGLTNYTLISTNQLISVPYAFYAEYSGSTPPKHYVGEFFEGGIIFYVDYTGNHGLICSLIDLSTAMTWSDFPTTAIGVSAQSDWNGKTNSTAIILQSASTSTADVCNNYTNSNYGTGVYSDWYLPAIDQLSLIYHAKYQLNKAIDTDGNAATTLLTKHPYWSSTESTSISAWAYDFVTGSVIGNDKLCTPIYVRAIRDF
jgi:hypothetical protein